MKNRFIPLLLMVLIAAGGSACRSKDDVYTPVINPLFVNKSKEEIFQGGEALFADKKFARSRQYFTHVYENFPNDPLARRSLLRIADTYYHQRGTVNLVEAQYKYRDFINRYPGSEFADYSMLQIANVAFLQMEGPERDQTKTREAVQKYKEMLELYPNSKYRPEAETNLQKALDRLARHEHLVAKFYLKRGDASAALPRLNYIVQQYPNYGGRDAMFFDLGIALQKLGREGEARLYFERVISEFPESDFAGRARDRLEDLPA